MGFTQAECQALLDLLSQSVSSVNAYFQDWQKPDMADVTESAVAKLQQGAGVRSRVPSMPKDVTICNLCRKPITVKVYYQGGDTNYPVHGTCRIEINTCP